MNAEVKPFDTRGAALRALSEEGSHEPDDRLKPLTAAERESKDLIYQRLLKVMDLSLIGGLEDRDARRQIRDICDRLMSENQVP